jgi:hypothetical protein
MEDPGYVEIQGCNNAPDVPNKPDFPRYSRAPRIEEGLLLRM